MKLDASVSDYHEEVEESKARDVIKDIDGLDKSIEMLILGLVEMHDFEPIKNTELQTAMGQIREALDDLFYEKRNRQCEVVGWTPKPRRYFI